jgi:glycosyltransferase involved in cell wall biosynthesis
MFDTFRRVTRMAAAGVLQPDPAVLWAPAAVLEGRRLLSELPHSAIVATGPPFSCFLIGRALQRVSSLPLVLDYRDEWDLSHRFLENRGSGVLATRLQHAMQRRVMRAANAVIATTTRSVAALEQVRNEAGSRAPVLCIRNGFDPDDFDDGAGACVREDRSRYRVVYAGTLWNLTSVEPFVRAIRLFADREPGLAARLEVVFAGRRTRDQDALLRPLTSTPIRLIAYPYMDHESVLKLVRSADLLCALLTDAADAERVLPGKIFEYMASRRPVLAIAPRGELWEILDTYPHAYRFLPSDIAGIATFLLGQAASYRGERSERPLPWDASPYDRRRQAGQLAELLDAVADFEPASPRHPVVSCT